MYKRLVLKLSGEALTQKGVCGIDASAAAHIAQEIASIARSDNHEIIVVVGGGNLFRGGSEGTIHKMHHAQADAVGMLATVMNALVLQSHLRDEGISAHTLSAFPVGSLCTYYDRQTALNHLANKHVVLCAGGTGNPYFTTDTTAVLRSLELNGDVILKATKVDGVFDKDPMEFPDAVRYDTLTYTDGLRDNLKIMDGAALALCRDHNLTTIVFNLFSTGALARAASGETIGTRITA